MNKIKAPIAFLASVTLLLAVASPSLAASTQYFSGQRNMNQIAQSSTYSSTGGRTTLGTRAHFAVNSSAQSGYVFQSSQGVKETTLVHNRRANVRNQAHWTTGGSHASGSLHLRAYVHY